MTSSNAMSQALSGIVLSALLSLCVVASHSAAQGNCFGPRSSLECVDLFPVVVTGKVHWRQGDTFLITVAATLKGDCAIGRTLTLRDPTPEWPGNKPSTVPMLGEETILVLDERMLLSVPDQLIVLAKGSRSIAIIQAHLAVSDGNDREAGDAAGVLSSASDNFNSLSLFDQTLLLECISRERLNLSEKSISVALRAGLVHGDPSVRVLAIGVVRGRGLTEEYANECVSALGDDNALVRERALGALQSLRNEPGTFDWRKPASVQPQAQQEWSTWVTQAKSRKQSGGTPRLPND